MLRGNTEEQQCSNLLLAVLEPHEIMRGLRRHWQLQRSLVYSVVDCQCLYYSERAKLSQVLSFFSVQDRGKVSWLVYSSVLRPSQKQCSDRWTPEPPCFLYICCDLKRSQSRYRSSQYDSNKKPFVMVMIKVVPG